MAAERILNRRPQKYDHRDFALSDYITPQMRRLAAGIDSKDWPMSRVLDQGATPHCVGYAWAGFGIVEPIVDDWNNDMGENIYYAAKVADGEPGQEDGSDTRSGVKAFMEFGKLDQDTYAFATSIEDIIVWVLTMGPVVTGTDWYSGMMDPDSQGLLHATGSIMGGHEWLITGVDKTARQFHMTNSWGLPWGFNGQANIGFDDYLKLFNQQGDAVTTMEVSSAPIPTPTPNPEPTPAPSPAPIPDPVPHVPAWFIAFLKWLLKTLTGE